MQLFDRNRENYKLIDRDFLRVIDLYIKKIKIPDIKVYLYTEKIKILFKKNEYQMIYDFKSNFYNVYFNSEFKQKYKDSILAFVSMWNIVCSDYFYHYYNEINSVDKKICIYCERELSISKFYNRYDSRDGKRIQCKVCFNKANRKRKRGKNK